MEFTDCIIVFASTFFNVFLLGFNSKNVHQSRYLLAFLTSWGITVAQYFFVKYATHGSGVEFVMVAGVGGSLGIVFAIIVHDHVTPKLDSWKRRKKLSKALKHVKPNRDYWGF